MIKDIIVSAGVSALVAVSLVLLLTPATPTTIGETLGGKTHFGLVDTSDGYTVDGTTVIDGSGNIDAPITSTTGTFSSTLGVAGNVTVSGELTNLTNTVAISGAATGYTVTAAQSGTTFTLERATGTTITLPNATNSVGAFYRFVVSAAFATDNYIIDSAEGDNIEGTLIVAGAVVDCDAEDQINLVADGENLGDYVEVYADGTQWLILDSGVLASAKATCTDPS